MKREHLIQQARSIFLHLKRIEKKNINPYASFADQIIALINNGQVSTKEDVIRYTRMSYPRPRMNPQWRTFGNVLDKDLPRLNKDTLLYFFGYLKRVLTIEGKREFEDRTKDQKGGQRYQGRYPGSKRKNHYKHQR